MPLQMNKPHLVELFQARLMMQFLKWEKFESNSLGSQDQGRSSIRKEYSKFYNFVKGGNDGLSSLRRETMFINILTRFASS
jgi:hypothetical protein